jgi:hypothetical protein
VIDISPFGPANAPGVSNCLERTLEHDRIALSERPYGSGLAEPWPIDDRNRLPYRDGERCHGRRVCELPWLTRSTYVGRLRLLVDGAPTRRGYCHVLARAA